MTDSIDSLLAQYGKEISEPASVLVAAPTQHVSEKGKPNPVSHLVPTLQSSSEFVRGFKPPDYLIDGLVQRGYIYAVTAATGVGKTAISLRLMASTALGCQIADRQVERGRCIMLVGENPDDVRARWIGMADQMGFDPDKIDVHFVAGVFPFADLIGLLPAQAKEIGGVSLVVVDTAAAYFDGDDENDNKQQGDYARILRKLTRLPGRPCVLVNCHPAKNAGPENLVPRGGGAFLAEMDGNLCCTATDSMVSLHWQKKFRGPDFAPLPFEMKTIFSERLKDSKGRPMPTVVARPLTEAECEAQERVSEHDQRDLLAAMADNEGASVAELGRTVGWVSSRGEPAKSKVHRALRELGNQKLATQTMRKWGLTATGRQAARNARRDNSAGTPQS